ncbi:TPA: hypothetical protein HA338_05895 [Methanosarcina acetivorans]|uniref:Uncharacterized protein n=2 Tax=Methanosarcina acetivorans TaxID=2214 RepID=Q8TPN0_METAC|nr:hypothetical protein [Methanosarcina acetivorans]AAM05281.1 predicted protein [Methanosarcina acetivorans C2A]HIH93573.1 hypothetical protein [Methanosarcina acetivorans]
MTFQKTYADEDFLAALDPEKFRTAAFVAKQVGCALSTAKAALDKLVASGAAKKVAVDDGATYVFLKM